ncbi:MAG TPA: hypothetical protein VFP21_05860 [Solirubrobacterales bacterium]|nr:hypothetical protein [Solirubrobacterales bacterium]
MRSNDGRSSSERLLFWVELVGGTLAILVILHGVFGGWISSVFQDGGAGEIEVVVAGVENQTERMTVVGGSMVQTRATTPRVDVTLRNTGGESVLLTEARITVEDSTWLPVCVVTGAGPVPVAGRYAVKLPFLAAAGEKALVKPLHDVVPPGQVDRFQVYLGTTRSGEDDNLYALHVEVETDGGKTVDAGRFVLGVPTTVSRAGYVLPEDDTVLHTKSLNSTPMESAWCFRHNLATMDRVLKHPGKRSAEIAALSHIAVAPDWSRVAGEWPPEAAVKPLLADRELDYAPMLAVFAAEESGDRDLLQRTRHEATTILLDRAERALGPGPRFLPIDAIEDARVALSLAPSARGRELLSRAEARQREEEEELEEQELG